MSTKDFTQEQKFMYSYLDEFRAFVIDSMGEGFHTDFEDHDAFIAAAFQTFVDIKNLMSEQPAE